MAAKDASDDSGKESMANSGIVGEEEQDHMPCGADRQPFGDALYNANQKCFE